MYLTPTIGSSIFLSGFSDHQCSLVIIVIPYSNILGSMVWSGVNENFKCISSSSTKPRNEYLYSQNCECENFNLKERGTRDFLLPLLIIHVLEKACLRYIKYPSVWFVGTLAYCLYMIEEQWSWFYSQRSSSILKQSKARHKFIYNTIHTPRQYKA